MTFVEKEEVKTPGFRGGTDLENEVVNTQKGAKRKKTKKENSKFKNTGCLLMMVQKYLILK